MAELGRLLIEKTFRRRVTLDEKLKEEAISTERYNKRRSAVHEVKFTILSLSL